MDWCTAEVRNGKAARKENLKREISDMEDGTIPATEGWGIIGRTMIVRVAGGHREEVCAATEYVEGGTWEGW